MLCTVQRQPHSQSPYRQWLGLSPGEGTCAITWAQSPLHGRRAAQYTGVSRQKLQSLGRAAPKAPKNSHLLGRQRSKGSRPIGKKLACNVYRYCYTNEYIHQNDPISESTAFLDSKSQKPAPSHQEKTACKGLRNAD